MKKRKITLRVEKKLENYREAKKKRIYALSTLIVRKRKNQHITRFKIKKKIDDGNRNSELTN